MSQLAIHMLLQMVSSLFFSSAADMIHGALCLDLGSLSYFFSPTAEKHFSKTPPKQWPWCAWLVCLPEREKGGKKRALPGKTGLDTTRAHVLRITCIYKLMRARTGKVKVSLSFSQTQNVLYNQQLNYKSGLSGQLKTAQISTHFLLRPRSQPTH